MASTVQCTECNWSVKEVSPDELYFKVRGHYQKEHNKYISRAEILEKAKPA
jgi:predicted small metal-binding protein